MSYLGRSNHRLHTCMYIVTICDARCVIQAFGYMCSSPRVLCGRFVWHVLVRPRSGRLVPAGMAIADALLARSVIAKSAISLAPYVGALVARSLTP